MFLVLEALANMVDVQLRAMLCVVVIEELQELLRLLVDFFCAARGVLASAAGRFDGRMQTSKTSAVFRKRLLDASPASA